MIYKIIEPKMDTKSHSGRPPRKPLTDDESIRRFRALVNKLAGLRESAKPTRHDLDRVGSIAANAVGRSRAWSGSYLYMLLRNTDPKYMIHEAILAALEAAWTKTIEARKLRFSSDITVEENTLILVSSRHCLGCDKPFIPRVYNQRFCGSPCKRR